MAGESVFKMSSTLKKSDQMFGLCTQIFGNRSANNLNLLNLWFFICFSSNFLSSSPCMSELINVLGVGKKKMANVQISQVFSCFRENYFKVVIVA